MPWIAMVVQISSLSLLAQTAAPAFEEYFYANECDGGGWPDGGGDGWEDWTDMIAETGCIPADYDYYMLPDPNPEPAGPTTAESDANWAPGEDPPPVAPDNCDFYDWTRDPWIYLQWGCG
jgi:hypothetical protein